MKKSFLIFLAVVMTVTMFAGCKTMEKSYPGTALVPQPADYKISGEVTGKGETIVILGFITIGKREFGHTYQWAAANPLAFLGFLSSFSGRSIAESNAMYDALGKMKGADKVIEPKWEVQSTGIPILFTKYSVTVTAKAITFTGPSQYGR